ncbi:MAG: alpha/beta fold hydrolase [Actinobacteria bacterium]|nr:alpha/beta fold hydrolase [Actinomycetota bacterium]
MADQPRALPVLLLHSAGFTPQMWQSQVEAIAAGLGEVPAIAPWLAGLRPGRQGELSLSGAADEVAGTLDRYGIEKARLVGHQLGAMVALQVAVSQPERVTGLVLSGAFAAPGKMALRFQKSLIRMLPNRALADSGATKDDLVRALDLMATADFGPRLRDVTADVLIVAGAADPALPAARQLAEQLPSARLEVLDGAGATPSLEAPDAYNALLVEFLAP